MTLDPTWREWVLLNLGRGCSHDSMVSDMVRAGQEPQYARAMVELLAGEQAASSTQERPVEGRRETGTARQGGADGMGLGRTELVVGAGTAPVSGGVQISPGREATSKMLSGSFVSEPSRLVGDNVIRTSDRDVRIVMRFRQPDVVVLADLFSPDECDELVRLSVPKIQRSTTVDPATGKALVIENRTSHGTYFHLNETEFIARLDRRIGEVMNWPVENGEGLQIIHYGPGGEYRPHFDYFPPEQAGSEQHMSQGGQRVATLITYLNDAEEGGATVFPEIGLAISPRKGQAVYFSYFNSLGQIDPQTLHGGAPVLKGEKWIATKWMRRYRRG